MTHKEIASKAIELMEALDELFREKIDIKDTVKLKIHVDRQIRFGDIYRELMRHRFDLERIKRDG